MRCAWDKYLEIQKWIYSLLIEAGEILRRMLERDLHTQPATRNTGIPDYVSEDSEGNDKGGKESQQSLENS